MMAVRSKSSKGPLNGPRTEDSVLSHSTAELFSHQRAFPQRRRNGSSFAKQNHLATLVGTRTAGEVLGAANFKLAVICASHAGRGCTPGKRMY